MYDLVLAGGEAVLPGKGATACRVDEKVLFSVLNTNPLREQEVVMLV